MAVASAGSAAMQVIADAVRAADTPARYRRVLLGSRLEVVLGLLSYVGLLTCLFVVDPRALPRLLDSLFGRPAPTPAAFVLLLVLWDVCYRIGAAWWASVTSFWREYVLLPTGGQLDPVTARSLRRADLATLAFGPGQIALARFVLAHPFLLVAVGGHVAAVGIVTVAAIARQTARQNQSD